ncbi:Rab family GTPase [Rhabdochromatium marinum]|uniref:Rab family GTPase n=1 Tax=Rhabdochromatium marinum TaxID=48729 RepID=UPI001A91B6B7|nr:Rab family GTPase [Rhabdochromatium marinum]MBK1648402.1 GTP-binding protein [Rhabdochromatium marinum]
MIQKKICMLGSFAVGKTSLVQRYVTSQFSEKYLTTVGVKVDKKVVQIEDQEVKLMLWDLAGNDVFSPLNMSYLRGMAGYILVIDGTRIKSFESALTIYHTCQQKYRQAAVQVAVNKVDIQEQWEVTDAHLAQLHDLGIEINLTSAKTAQAVEDIFIKLARA